MEASKNTEARGATAELPHVQYMSAFIVQCECSMTQVFQGFAEGKRLPFSGAGWRQGGRGSYIPMGAPADQYGIVFRTIVGTAEVSTSFRSLHFVI